MSNNYGVITKFTIGHNPHANTVIDRIHKEVNGMKRSFDLEKNCLNEDNP
jgi:hypothetical protein